MAMDNNLAFDISDPLGLRAPIQTYHNMSQEEFDCQRLEDDRQAALANKEAVDEDLSLDIWKDILKSPPSKARHSIPRARPLTRRSEAEETVDQMYAEVNDEPFNLDASRLEQSRLALEAAHNWEENHLGQEAWGPSIGPQVSGPAPPTPYDAFAPLPNPQVVATAAPPFMSQSPTAPSPNV